MKNLKKCLIVVFAVAALWLPVLCGCSSRSDKPRETITGDRHQRFVIKLSNSQTANG